MPEGLEAAGWLARPQVVMPEASWSAAYARLLWKTVLLSPDDWW